VRGGFTVIELTMSLGLATMLGVAICSFYIFTSRSIAALYNYTDLDDCNRNAMDTLTRDIRQANRVLAASTNFLVMEDGDGLTLFYIYSDSTRDLFRYKNGSLRTLLTECDRLEFTIGQRNTVNGSYDVYPAATAATAKVVNVSWLCSRPIIGRPLNTESVQTARIVIRKQGT
jgi:Tfp pilus assembly protein PilW